MKNRLFTLILFVIITVSITCLAEDFTIHSGTKFGDTIEEVKEKETLLFRGEWGANTIYFRGKVAGFDNVLVFYTFDNDKLIEANYDFNRYDGMLNSSQIQEIYKALLQGLTNKYGEPENDNDAIKYHLPSRKLNGFIKTDLPKELINLDFWIVPCDDYYVKIELLHEMIKDSIKRNYDCYISYLLYTDEMAEEAVRLSQLAEELKEKEQEKINDDL